MKISPQLEEVVIVIDQMEITFTSDGQVGNMNYRASCIGDLGCLEENKGDVRRLGMLSGDQRRHDHLRFW